MLHQIAASIWRTDLCILTNHLSDLVHMMTIFSSPMSRWVLDNFMNKIKYMYFFCPLPIWIGRKLNYVLFPRSEWAQEKCVQIQHARQRETKACPHDRSRSYTKNVATQIVHFSILAGTMSQIVFFLSNLWLLACHFKWCYNQAHFVTV
jgi:hypothetical protein